MSLCCGLQRKPDVHKLINLIKEKSPELATWVHSPKLHAYSVRNFSTTLHDYRYASSIMMHAIQRYSTSFQLDEATHEQIFQTLLPVYMDLCIEHNSLSLLMFLWLTLQLDAATKNEVGDFWAFLMSRFCNLVALHTMRWLDSSLKAIMVEELKMWHAMILAHGLPP